MASYFFDSSAIMKRYYREPGTDWVQAICRRSSRSTLYLAELARVEVVAALRRTVRVANLHPSYGDALVSMFQRHVALSATSGRIYTILPLDTVVVDLAETLCSRFWDTRPHPLRSLDALQLASALLVADKILDELVFVTTDVRLLAIAPLAGFRVIDPVHP
ncbi:MAG: type II toxin-antitoxin system VapC family toxin [Ktedonobacterales bacterium]